MMFYSQKLIASNIDEVDVRSGLYQLEQLSNQ